MRKTLKLVSITFLLSNFCTTNILAEVGCPQLALKELRQLCRWTGLSKLPLLKIKAGKVEKDGVTLENKLKTCGEGDSIKQFLSNDSTKVYVGKSSKSFVDPNNPLKGQCVYTLNNEKIAFDVELPPQPKTPQPTMQTKENINPPPPPPRRKVVGGVDITTSPKVQNVIVRPTAPVRPTRPAPQSQGTPSGSHPVPSHLRKQQSPHVGSSIPPSEKPPLPPIMSTEQPNMDMRSELAQRLAEQKNRY